MVRIFWLGFARWAATPGNDERAAVFVANMLERAVVATEEGSTTNT
jgi:hypothetical protein